MAEKRTKVDRRLIRQRKYLDEFSNYESAVNLICSLEAWFEYRWGAKGQTNPGLLECFNRFPHADGLTPDFEIRFHTPYIIWGDHKRTIQSADKDRHDAVNQILKYAARRTIIATSMVAGPGSGEQSSQRQGIDVNYDVVVLVNAENDDIAANAINIARQTLLDRTQGKGEATPKLAPIIVLGCYLDRESRGEWYKIKWREHHGNHRFSSPNVSASPVAEDLNKLIVDASHHAIPVNKAALGLTGRNPFINDSPPPLYTVTRLIIPALNELLSDDDHDQLQSKGNIAKSITKLDLLGAQSVRAIQPRPIGLSNWLDAALDFLETELHYARKVLQTDPQQYVVTIDGKLIKSDPLELFSDRAAKKTLGRGTKGQRRKWLGGDPPGQMKLFE